MIITVIFVMRLCHAGSVDEFYQQGVQAYQTQAYDQAIELWEEALRHGKASAALYYNLGNAYYKTEDIGRAILNYERAHKLAPNDEDIEFNLGVARLSVVDKIASPELDYFFKMFNRVKYALVLPQWTWLVAGLYILWMALLVMRLAVRKGLLVHFQHAVFPIFVMLLIAVFFLTLRVREDKTSQEAIILHNNVTVLSGPQTGAVEVFTLHSGVKVGVVDRSGDYVRIRLTDGKDGWVSGQTLQVI